MGKRKSLPKSTRFEVFKRDSFTCQYCGRSAPDVILEVDHIVPVASGGTDDVVNLVTACRDCNRGKGARELSDDAVIKKQKAQLDDLNAKREQAEMMAQWRKMLQDVVSSQVDAIADYITCITGSWLSAEGERNMRTLIRRFGFQEVYTATEIAFEKYYHDDDASWEYAFNKIGGICYNRKFRGCEDWV